MPKGVYQRKPRQPKRYPEDMVARVQDMYAEGHTQTEIAAAEGVSQKIIFTLMKHHGLAARVAAKRDQRGENNSSWRGDGATYAAFHRRLYSRFGKPSKCTVCGTEASNHYDYANLSGRYEDIEDYAAMCRSCHWKYDGKVKNILKAKGGMSNAQA